MKVYLVYKNDPLLGSELKNLGSELKKIIYVGAESAKYYIKYQKNPDDWHFEEWEVFHSGWDALLDDEKRARENALEKLTPEERELLGFV